MLEMLDPYLKALGLTIIIESLIILPYFGSRCKEFKKLVINFLLINCITNLSLNIFIGIFGINYFILVLELMIPFVEAYMFIYAGVTKKRIYVVITCFVANVLSFVIGTYAYLILSYISQPSSAGLIGGPLV